MMAGMGRCPGLELEGLNLVWAGLERTSYQERRKRRAGIGRGWKGWGLCLVIGAQARCGWVFKEKGPYLVLAGLEGRSLSPGK